MADKLILEIAVQTARAAQTAERAGAHRIELCEDLPMGGVTPSVLLMREARHTLKIPIHVMIRPRAGTFVYSSTELATMRASIKLAQANGMNGIVLGVLKTNKTVDVEVTQQLVEAAQPLPVTFHRAFDACANADQALQDCIRAGAKRVLTSGGASTVSEGLAKLAQLVEAAQNRIIVMPGGGIRPANLREVRRATAATEFHSGLGTVLPYGHDSPSHFEIQVHMLLDCLA